MKDDTIHSLKKTNSSSSKDLVTVGGFYTNHAEHFQLKLVSGAVGLGREIVEGAVNPIGLALTGFYQHFPASRLQIMGKGEYAYFQALESSLKHERMEKIFSKKIPCMIFAENITPPALIKELSERWEVPLFCSPMNTMRLINSLTLRLESDFAPTSTEHGCMVDIQGVGVLIRGESGIGKSECVLSLLKRGYSLVADDITKFKYVDGWELMGMASDLTRNYMEVRGIGIINIASMFGASSIRHQKRLDLVVTLKDWNQVGHIERIGLDQQFYEVLKVKLPHVVLPVRAGRDLAGLVEVAAMNQKLRLMGQDSAAEFNEKLLNKLQNREM